MVDFSSLSDFFLCLFFKYLIETDLIRFLMELQGVAGLAPSDDSLLGDTVLDLTKNEGVSAGVIREKVDADNEDGPWTL